jgi:hypothetical protein
MKTESLARAELRRAMAKKGHKHTPAALNKFRRKMKLGFVSGAWVNCLGMLWSLVLCIGVGRVLVQWLGGTMGAGERRAGKHEHEQHRGKNPLHAKNVALTSRHGEGYQSTCTN